MDTILMGGHYKCLLHPESKHRNDYDKVGFPVCLKSNLLNPQQVRRHMEAKHPPVWREILLGYFIGKLPLDNGMGK